MRRAAGTALEQVPLADHRAIDALCTRFERAWRRGEEPHLEDYWTQWRGPGQAQLFRELLAVELDYRRRRGDAPRVRDYTPRFPEQATAIEDLLQATPTPEHVAAPRAVPESPSPGVAAAGRSSRVRIALAGGSGLELTADIVPLLRGRLRIVAVLLAAIFGVYFLMYMLRALIFGEVYAVTRPGLLLLLIGAVVLSGLALLLWTSWARSLARLRTVELLLFGLTTAMMVWTVWAEPPERIPDLHKPGVNLRLDRHADGQVLGWFALIVVYGTFIPNSARRCAVVVGCMAGLGVGVDLLVQPFLLPTTLQVAQHVFLVAAWQALAVALAVGGSYRISTLQQEAYQARQLGQYRLLERLGVGGMGEVYLAEHQLLRRPCALKLIRPERAGDPYMLKRFGREVQATASLTHPNTVQIYDYGHTEDGTFYYVMEYLPGLNLEQLVGREGPLPPARVVHLLRQVCGALREAHAVGLIHRDIKPSNMIVGDRGGMADVVKLLDFGLVQPLHVGAREEHRSPDGIAPAGPAGLSPSQERLTQEGTLAGTPAYMAPEQAAGQEHLDARTDIYGLGAVAYYLLTGQPPFVRPTPVQVLAAHLGEPPLPPSQLGREIPADLEAVVLRCLEKDPDRRYPNSTALEQAL